MKVYVVVRLPTYFDDTVDVVGVFATETAALKCATNEGRNYYEVFEKDVINDWT
jgi:hypothetical protein